MKPAVVFALLALAFALPCASAVEVSRASYEFYLVGSSSYASEELDFLGKVTGAFQPPLPPDAEGVSFYIDGRPAEYSGQLRLESADVLKVSYVTSAVIDKGNFLVSIPVRYNTSRMEVMLVLEEGASIAIEKREGISTSSVFPKPDEITSDGKSIILKWGFESLQKGDEVSIYVRVRHPGGRYRYALLAVAAFVLATAAILAQWKSAGKKNRAVKEPAEKKEEKEEMNTGHEKSSVPETPAKNPETASKTGETEKPEKEPEFLKNLKDDEQQVIRVLMLKEGSCEQGTLRIATDFSKAKLSRILSELEERNIVSKEKRGKKNLIFLK